MLHSICSTADCCPNSDLTKKPAMLLANQEGECASNLRGNASLAAVMELASCEARLQHWAEGLAVLERGFRTLADRSVDPVNPPCSAITSPGSWPSRHRNLAILLRLSNSRTGRWNWNRQIPIMSTPSDCALYRAQEELPLAIETLKLSLRGSSMPIFDLYVLALCYQKAGNLQSAEDHAARANYLFERHAQTWSHQERTELRQLREEYSQVA